MPGTIRCGEHSDYGTLTFLMQDDIGGLQVKALQEGWIQATPVEDSIIVWRKWKTITNLNGLNFELLTHRSTWVTRWRSSQLGSFPLRVTGCASPWPLLVTY